MRRLLAILIPGLTCLAATLPALAADPVLLQSGQGATFSLAGRQLTNPGYAIDVSGDAKTIRFDVAGGSAGVDVDLVVRYGSAFPEIVSVTTPDEAVFRSAQYVSASGGGTETVVVSDSSFQPVRAGRWFVSVYNYSTTSTTNVTLTATVSNTAPGNAPITVDFTGPQSANCDLAPWNDATPRSAVGGNNGSTLGEQRRNAVLHAASLLSQQLKSATPIRVRACWKNEGGDANGAVLAFARPGFYIIGGGGDANYLPDSYTYYPGPAVIKLSGTTRCGISGSCTEPDIFATFNTDVDGPVSLGARSFYYGLNPPGAPTNDADFVSTAMHEITHGLGFIGLVNLDAEDGPIGAKPNGYDDIYDKQIVSYDIGTLNVRPFMALTDAERAATLTTPTGLRWGEIEAVNSVFNQFSTQAAPDNLPYLHAPTTISTGSTLSHIGAAHANEIMRAVASGAQRTLSLAQPMLHAVGWNPAPRSAPNYATPIPGNWYDRTRVNHGFDFQRVFGNVYVLTFYTFDSNGRPEWYLAAGPVIDGKFLPTKNTSGNSLLRSRYTPGQNPPQTLDNSLRGLVSVDFNQGAGAVACRNADRSGALQLGVMEWTIGSQSGTWCMEPIVGTAQHPTPNFNGHWYAGLNDQGWGMSILEVAQPDNTPLLFVLLYYPDANGNPRWAAGSTADFVSGMQINLIERRGYCRNCTATAAVDTLAGSITLTLVTPAQDNLASGNRVAFNATFQGPEGGNFARTTIPIALLSAPIVPGQ